MTPLAAGIDVSLTRGLDVVVLDGARQVLGVHRRLPVDDLAAVLGSIRPAAVAVDAPDRWAPPGERRAAERQLASLGIRCFWTPDEAGSGHPFHGWMHVGMAVHATVRRGGLEALEVFPHASAVALAGWQRPPGALTGAARRRWRAGLLAGRGLTVDRLRSHDEVDAGLAALTAAMALAGDCFTVGDARGGWITLPGRRPVVE